MHKRYLLSGALLGAIAVVLGAFGAHQLKQIATPEMVATFQTGVQYQMYHALALLATGILHERFNKRFLNRAGICFIAGVILFSGSLYLLTVLKVAGSVGVNGIGIITPFGGLFFIAGWLFLCWGIWKSN